MLVSALNGMCNRWFTFVSLLLCRTRIFESLFVSSWGRDGHQVVGNIAWKLLSNNSREIIRLILNATNMENHQNTSNCFGYCSPLAVVADWADEVRYSKNYHWTAPLHYIDVRDDIILPNGCPIVDPGETIKRPTEINSMCHFNRSRDCLNDFCVAGAIVNYTSHLHRFAVSSAMNAKPGDASQIISLRASTKRHLHKSRNPVLLSSSLSEAARIEVVLADFDLTLRDSLCFVIHFIGDIHQPLHCSRQTDRGGNTILVKYHDKKINRVKRYSRYNKSKSYPLNLHGFWDDTIIEQSLYNDFNKSRNLFEISLLEYIHDMQVNHPDVYYDKWTRCGDGSSFNCTEIWGDESLQSALQYSYRNVDGSAITNGTELSNKYYSTSLPVVRERLALAGVRLAMTLEAIFTINVT